MRSYIIEQYKPKKCKKQSHYSPGQTLRLPGNWGSQISRQSVHEGGKVVSPTHRPPLPPRKYSWYSFLLEAESTPGAIVRLEGLCQWKIPMTSSGIKPATFRLVAQCPLYPDSPDRLSGLPAYRKHFFPRDNGERGCKWLPNLKCRPYDVYIYTD